MCFAVSKAAEAAKAAESVKAAKAAEAAKAAKAATKQAAAAQKKAAAEEASHRREAERLARDAQLQEQQRAAARERAEKWEREREAVLAASKKLASRARARAAKAETDAKEEATREWAQLRESHTQSRRGRGKAGRLNLPSLACLLLAAVGWARLSNVHRSSASFLEAVRASPFDESLFNGQPGHERPQRFHGRSAVWTPEEEVTIDRILDDAVSLPPRPQSPASASVCLHTDALATIAHHPTVKWSRSTRSLPPAWQGLMATSDGRRKEVKDCYALKSISCLPEGLARSDVSDAAAVIGRQPRHWDVPDQKSGEHLKDLELPPADVPLSVMVAIEPGAKLWIYPDGCSSAEETALLIDLEVGDVLVWRGDLVHAGAGYEVEHYRIHAYIDSPFFYREKGTGLCVRRPLSGDARAGAAADAQAATLARDEEAAKGKAAAEVKAAKQARTKKPNTHKQSTKAVLAALKGLGFTQRGKAARDGDCFPLAAMAGFEIAAAKAARPDPVTLSLVKENGMQQSIWWQGKVWSQVSAGLPFGRERSCLQRRAKQKRHSRTGATSITGRH